MNRQEQEEIRENAVKKLHWHMGTRDDRKIARHIHKNRQMDGIYELDDNGILDGFYEWLEEAGVIKMLKEISPSGVQRMMIPFFQYVVVYFLKVLYGIESICSLPRLLFSNQGAMKIAGFNAHQIENGICERGKSKTGKHKSKTGPICDDTLARNIVKVPLKVIESFFNRAVRLLAREGFFDKHISVIIDPTDIHTTDKWDGCGSVTRKKRVQDKRGRWKEIEITVYGWKLMAVFYAPLKIPLAAKLMKIQESEKNYTMELIKKAEDNLAGYCRIKRVKMDRGHLDGKTLWQMHKAGYQFVIPGRGDMQITRHARRLAALAVKEAGIPNNGEIKTIGRSQYIQVREEKITRGIGKKQRTEVIRTVVVGLRNLAAYDQYGTEGFEKDRHKREFKPHKINAVVVVEWDGKNYGENNWVVYLTNMKVNIPMKVFDEYDERSIIENSLFKEAKQGWFIKHVPQKTERALQVHVFFTLAVFALTNIYKKYKQEKEEKEAEEEANDFLLGIRRWREKQNMASQDKGLVFIGERYGIFYLAELMVLLDVKVKDIPLKAGTQEEILARYGLPPRRAGPD
jgi:hypothetical protein